MYWYDKNNNSFIRYEFEFFVEMQWQCVASGDGKVRLWRVPVFRSNANDQTSTKLKSN
jgi:hypothetical protein